METLNSSLNFFSSLLNTFNKKYQIKYSEFKELQELMNLYETKKDTESKLFLELKLDEVFRCNIDYEQFKFLVNTNNPKLNIYYYIRGYRYLLFESTHYSIKGINIFNCNIFVSILMLICWLVFFVYSVSEVYIIGFSVMPKLLISIILFILPLLSFDEYLQKDSAKKLVKSISSLSENKDML